MRVEKSFQKRRESDACQFRIYYARARRADSRKTFDTRVENDEGEGTATFRAPA